MSQPKSHKRLAPKPPGATPASFFSGRMFWILVPVGIAGLADVGFGFFAGTRFHAKPATRPASLSAVVPAAVPAVVPTQPTSPLTRDERSVSPSDEAAPRVKGSA